MTALRSGMTVNEMIRLFPATVKVFDRFGIDSCCGGALPFLEAAAHHRIDEHALLDALEEAVASGKALQGSSLPPTDAFGEAL